MARQIESGFDTLTAAEALEAWRNIKLDSSGNAVYADAGDEPYGTTVEAASNGDLVAVRLRSAEGTVKVEAAGVFAIGAMLYAAADGKVDDVPTGRPLFLAKEAASAAGDVVEALPIGASMANVADATLGVPVLIRVQVACSTGTIFNANCPRKLVIIDARVIATATNVGGTVKATDGTNDITDAMVCDTDKAVTRAGTIDDAYNTLAKGDTLKLVPAASAAGEVFVLALPIA